MIALAKDDDVAELKEIWIDSFGDELFIDLFFKHVFNPYDTLVCYSPDHILSKITSVLYLLTRNINIWGGRRQVGYIYAAATRQTDRNKGYMRSLIKESLKLSYDRGHIFSVLVPGDESLYNYYSRYNYVKGFYHKRKRLVQRQAVKAGNIEPAVCGIEMIDQLYFLYEKFYNVDKTLVLSKDEFELNMMDTEAKRKFYLLNDVNTCRNCGYAIVDEAKLLIEELGAEPDLYQDVLEVFLDLYNSGLEIIERPERGSEIPGSNNIPFGMARVVNVSKCLGLWASKNTEANFSFSVCDGIIDENNGLYIVRKGVVEKQESEGRTQITVENLTSLLLGYVVTEIDYNINKMFNTGNMPYMNMMMN